LLFIKDAQATGEAFSPQKRTSSTSKHENSVLFSIFVSHFCPPGSGSESAILMRIRIQQLKLMRIHAHPDPKPFIILPDPDRHLEPADRSGSDLGHKNLSTFLQILLLQSGQK
jgi:hypothetical protein